MQDTHPNPEPSDDSQKPPATGDPKGARLSGHQLIRRIRSDDADALHSLMRQYDRLVRYTVYRTCPDRCVQDSDWLDARASETWTGFLRSIRRPGTSPPDDLATYLVQIARNKCRDALRIGGALAGRTVPQEEADLSQLAVEQEDMADSLSRMEELEALRASIATLDPQDQALCAELDLIIERRWKEAADRLGIPESTLRSRWAGVLQRLRVSLDEKMRKISRSPPLPPTP